MIATGSKAFIPPIAGTCTTSAASCATARSYSARSTTATRFSVRRGASLKAAVIGGGLLGLEAAYGLLKLGVEVHVVHLMPTLMEMQLDAGAGDVSAAR